jgi:nucleoside-diphosphate-sugar epimerase
MRVLLTGSTGFIGTHVLAALLQDGIETISLSRSCQDTRDNHLYLDLFNIKKTEQALLNLNCTHLIHLGWYTEHGQFWSSPVNLKWIDATKHLLNCFFESGGVHAFIAGTCAEYEWQYGYCDEILTPILPRTTYGRCKHITHLSCVEIANHGNKTLTWGRIFNPYGPSEQPNRLIPSLIAALQNRIEPFGVNKSIYRDFLYVEDLAESIVHTTKMNYSGAINLSSGEPVSLVDIVTELSMLIGTSPEPILMREPRQIDTTKFLIGNNTRLLETGWQKRFSLVDGLSHYLSRTNERI